MRLNWKPMIVLTVVAASICAGLYFAQRELRERATEMLTSAYTESNPDVPTEAAWKAMSWEEKTACKTKFMHGLALREFESAHLMMLAVMAIYGIVGTVLALLCLIEDCCITKEKP